MVLDQRQMSGTSRLSSPEAVQEYWRVHARENQERHGFMFANRRDADRFRTNRRKLKPYLNHSRWVADCAMDDCNGGIAVWRENPQACCLDCGTIFTAIDWPDEMEDVEQTALLVPMPEERNWVPAREKANEARARLREEALL